MTLHSLGYSLKRSFSNSPPWSWENLPGKPNLRMKSLYNLSAAVLAFLLAVGYACVNPESDQILPGDTHTIPRKEPNEGNLSQQVPWVH